MPSTIHRFLLPALGAWLSLPAQEPVLYGAPAPGAEPAADAVFVPDVEPWPTSLSRSGGIRNLAPARLTGFVNPDVVVLEGSTLFVSTAPGLHASFGYLPLGGPNGGESPGTSLTGVSDFTVLVGRGAANGSDPVRDALAVVGPAGLRVWTRDLANGFGSVTTVADPAWQAASLVVAHPANPDLVFGITSAGTVLVTSLAGNASTTATFASGAAGVVLDLAAVDWNADGMVDLGILTTQGLRVVTATGQLLAVDPHAAPAGSLALVRGPATGAPAIGPQWLAWLVPGSGGRLRLCRAAGSADVPLLRDFAAVAAAEVDGDGWEELLLSTAGNEDVTVLFNLAPAGAVNPPFAHHAATGLRIATAATSASRPANIAPAAIADFDADGDPDLFAMVEADANTPARRMLQRPTIFQGTWAAPITLVDCVDNVPNDTLDVTVTFAVNHGGSHTEVAVWADEASGQGEALPDAVARIQVPNTGTSGQVALALPRSVFDNGGVYSIMVRPVQVTGGLTTASALAYCGSIHSGLGTASYARALAMQQGPGTSQLPHPTTTNLRVGGVVPRPKLPKVKLGKPPFY